MFRFLSKLIPTPQTPNIARQPRRTHRRARLGLEGLEDRLVMTVPPVTVQVIPQPFPQLAIMNILVTPPGQQITLQCNSNNNNEIDVLDGTTEVFHGLKQSFSAVKIFSASADSVVVNDSNGMPFAQNTAIDLFGDGSNNTLTLTGSRGVAGNETYVAGGATFTPGTISMDNLNFTLSNAIASVTDSIAISGTLDVQTSGTSVGLSNASGSTQTLSGMGFGGGDTLTYSNMPSVELETFAVNAGVFLDAPNAASGESHFNVIMHAAGEKTTLDETPKNVTTGTIALLSATNANVAVWGNFGPVLIAGNSSTGVNVGYPLNSTGPVTRGIEANVTVNGASYLLVNNSGNVTTNETVTVTDSTISGTGLFGSPGVTLSYSGIGQIDLNTGQLLDVYTVKPSSANARFTCPIDIFSNTSVAFNVTVDVDAPSDLNLTLYNQQQQLGALVVNTKGLEELSHTIPNGTIKVLFAGEPTSVISYNGFDKVPGG